jgi:hypothetical protein
VDRRGGQNSNPSTVKNFLFSTSSKTGSKARSASYPMGTEGFFPGVKLLGREADHSRSTSTEVKKKVDLYIHSPIRHHDVVLN